MKAAVFGPQGAGRKTLMTALSGGDSSTIHPGKKSVVTIKVPDQRIDWLASVFAPQKTTYATLEVVLDDTAYDSMGKRLNAMRPFEVLVLVAGAFGFGDESAESAMSDIEGVLDEMLLADLLIVEKRLEFFNKIGDKGQERKLFDRLQAALSEGRFLGEIPFIDAEEKFLTTYSFLTRKPLLVVVNVEEDLLGSEAWPRMESAIRARGAEPITLCADLEAEVATLLPEEQLEFLAEVGLSHPASHRLLQTVYKALDLISFFTVGEDEVRAWPTRANSPAPYAGGRIHSDIQRGFIRAEVVSYAHFQEMGSLAAARKTGRLRTEGKAYIVQDGDIINFLFNV
jgi:ribosome-binding ATPase YchF (GTP1/OBG family)